jgi:hypothetical protein
MQLPPKSGLVWKMPTMIRHVLGHHKRILVAPPDQIAHVAWDDIQPSIYHDYATATQSLHQLGSSSSSAMSRVSR